MYDTLIKLSTEANALNAAINYIVWTHFESGDKIEKVFNRTMYWNLGLAAGIIALGAYRIYYNTDNDRSTTDKVFRFAKIAFIALAIGLSGAAVSHWRFDLLNSK